MTAIILIVAIILGVVALKFVFGIIKFVVIAAIVIAALAYLGQRLR